MKVLYNKLKHEHIKDADIVTENLICYAKLKITKCRMDYGKARIFNSSRENNLTRGIPIRLFSANLVITVEKKSNNAYKITLIFILRM